MGITPCLPTKRPLYLIERKQKTKQRKKIVTEKQNAKKEEREREQRRKRNVEMTSRQ